MSSHIQLGAAGALRPYQLKGVGDDGISWRRSPANPFTSQVNTTNPYGEVGIWNEWVQEDWQAGVGRVDPEAGGFVYAEAETRVPKQVILPPLVQQCDSRTIANVKADCRYMPQAVAGTVSVGGSSGNTRLAMAFTTPGTVGSTNYTFHFYARIPAGAAALLKIRNDSTGSPGNTVVLNMYNSEAVDAEDPDRNFYWYGSFATVVAELSTATTYWLTIEPESASDTIEVAYGTSGYDTAAKVYDGASWSTQTGKYLLYTTSLHGSVAHNFIRFNNVLYAYTVGGSLYKYDSANEQFDSVGSITGTGNVTSAAIFGPTLFLARSTSNYTTMNTSESFSAASVRADLFLEYDGLLYRAYQNDLYYSADGSSWSAAFPVGGDDVSIRGMAGMGDSLYLATDKALYRFAPGDVVEEVTRFGVVDSGNGTGMVEYQGRLYIPAVGRVFRFDPSGQMQDIWVARDNDLPTTRIGGIAHLARMNNWLVAYSIGDLTVGRPSLWLWQEEGWHFLACAPNVVANTDTGGATFRAYYDRSTSRLWFSSVLGGAFFVKIDDYTLNPYNSSITLYMPYGWLEQDKFYGGFYSLNKVFYSVRIFGDNLSANVCAKLYWQDEGSTAWELLGTADSDGEELSWPIATRPLGKWLKLGILLQTNDSDETPRVRSIVTKTLPITNDRFRDTLTLRLEPNVQGPAGDPDTTYTVTQQVAHINSLISDDANFLHIYQDPFGTQYEVTIVDYSWGMPTYAWENGAKVIKAVEVTLIVEQVLEGTYA